MRIEMIHLDSGAKVTVSPPMVTLMEDKGWSILAPRSDLNFSSKKLKRKSKSKGDK